jgi:hypothetical protein
MGRQFKHLAILASAFLIPACGKKHSDSPPPPSAISVKISPASASVIVGGVQTFLVTVSETQNAAVIWSVNGIPGGNDAVGTIQPMLSGAQYAPNHVPSPNPVIVTATSQADPAVSGVSTVTVAYPNDTSEAQPLPIKLGTSGGNATDFTTSHSIITCCSGTLGCLVRRDGLFFILSNNHVLDRSGQGSTGDPVCQPGLVDNHCSAGTLVANVFQAAPLQTSNVDAALAKIVPGAVDTSGAIQDLGPAGSMTIAPAPPSSTLADPASVLAARLRVAKSGRTTGLTCGSLLSINTDISVDYSNSCAGPTAFTVTFHNQLIIDGGSFSEAGDSGSLIVTSDAARPLGLLYAGNGTVTVASPIADVLTALKNAATGELPAIVGARDHPVSCAAVAPIPSTKPQSIQATAPTTLELTRASAAKDKLGAHLMEDPAIAGLGIGTSGDNPAEGALLVYVRGIPRSPLPRQLDGVRTRIIRLEEAGRAPEEQPSMEHLHRTTDIKEQHSAEFLGKSGVVGVGVGRSEDAEGEPALIFYVERAAGFSGVDVEIDGVRTRVIEGERFQTFGWGKSREPGSHCCGDR